MQKLSCLVRVRSKAQQADKVIDDPSGTQNPI
jgi:hypothetical protein